MVWMYVCKYIYNSFRKSPFTDDFSQKKQKLINLVLLTYTTALTHICLWSHRFQGPCQLTHEPFKYWQECHSSCLSGQLEHSYNQECDHSGSLHLHQLRQWCPGTHIQETSGLNWFMEMNCAHISLCWVYTYFISYTVLSYSQSHCFSSFPLIS